MGNDQRFDQFRNMELSVSEHRSEIKLMSKIANPELLTQLNKTFEEVKYMQDQITLIFTNLENTAKYDEI